MIHSLLVRGIEASGYIYVYDNYRLAELPWDSAWTWVLCALGTDLAYYWVHRMAHGQSHDVTVTPHGSRCIKLKHVL